MQAPAGLASGGSKVHRRRTWPWSSPRCSCFRLRERLADSRFDSILQPAARVQVLAFSGTSIKRCMAVLQGPPSLRIRIVHMQQRREVAFQEFEYVQLPE